MWNQVVLQNSAINVSSDIWSRMHKEVFPIWELPPPYMYRTASVSYIYHMYNLHSWLLQPVLRTRIRLSIRKCMNRLSSQKMTCCNWPSGRLMCFWARRTQVWPFQLMAGYLYHSPSPAGTRHQPPIHRLAGNCKIHVGCHARLSLCTLNRRFSLARRYSTRSALSLVVRGRLVRLPQTKFPRSRNLLMMT